MERWLGRATRSLYYLRIMALQLTAFLPRQTVQSLPAISACRFGCLNFRVLLVIVLQSHL